MTQQHPLLNLADALTSGKYHRHTKELRGLNPGRHTGYCCLGVACDISNLGQWKKLDGQWNYVVSPSDRSSGVLPTGVGTLFAANTPLGIQVQEGTIFFHNLTREEQALIKEDSEVYRNKPLLATPLSAIALNDNGVSFRTIAKLIRNRFQQEGQTG